MTLRTALPRVALLVALGCSASPSIHDCTTDAECGTGNTCHQGSCATNGPPIADFAAPTSVTTHRMVALTPASTDPEGRPLEHRWSVRAIAGGCAPEPEPPTGSTLDVIFWCPGTYEATLVAVDPAGLESAPVSRAFEVASATGEPTVAAGPAISATHRCDPSVPRCVVLGAGDSTALDLTATATDPEGGPLSFEWAVSPPVGARDDAALAVTYQTGPLVDRPRVSISNEGGPIAGAYRFRVRVRDPQGLIAQAFQEVVVSNAPPTFIAGAVRLFHQYVDGTFVAEGELSTLAVDPEGDQLLTTGSFAAAAAGCTEEVTTAPSGLLHLRIVCSVASGLIGPTPRTLTATVTDASGAAATVDLPLVIVDRAPVVTLDPAYGNGLITVNHRVEPCALAAAASCFVVDGADPFVVSDPDGDPLGQYVFGVTVASNRPASRGAATIDGQSYRFRFETPASLPLEFRAASGASGFTLTASIQDPFGLTASVAVPLSIRNRRPRVIELVRSVSVNHTYDAARRRYLASAQGALFDDPDGDPLSASAVGYQSCQTATLNAGRAEIGCELAWDYTLGGLPPLPTFLTPGPVTVTASDGWEATASTTAVSLLDRPTTLSAPIASVENCGCVSGYPCAKYAPSATGVAVPIELVDPDGDPSQVSLRPTFATGAQPPAVTCIPGWCYPRGNLYPSFPMGTAIANQGIIGQAPEAEFRVSLTCSTAGTCCY
jgi:hypothetical protein